MKTRILHALPYVVFLVGLFFVERYLFGAEDALLGIVFQSFAKTMVEMPGLSFANYAKHASLFLIMSLASSVAGLHPVLLICGSAVYMFAIILLNSDDFLPRNFFMLGLGFLLLELYPISAEEIPMRLVATLFAITCTTVFVYAMRKVLVPNEIMRDRKQVLKAFDTVGFQLLNVVRGNNARVDSRDVYKIAQEYCNTEYGITFRQGGVLSGRQQYAFEVLLCLEQISSMIEQEAHAGRKLTEHKRQYFLDLSEIFLGCGNGQTARVRAVTSRLDAFLETHELLDAHEDTSWRSVLEVLRQSLADGVNSRDNSTGFSHGLRYRLRFLRENFTLKNSQIRFAIQLAVIVAISFCASEIIRIFFDTRFGAWIPTTAFLMMNTYTDQTMTLMRKQLTGMVIGMVIFVAVVHFLPSTVRMFCVLFFGYGVIIMGFGETASMAAGTQLALTALYPTMVSLGDTLIVRLIFVLTGTLVVLSLMFIIMRPRRTLAIAHKMQEMQRVDKRLLGRIRVDIQTRVFADNRSIQLLYYLHMNAYKLSTLASQVDSSMAQDVNRLIEANYNFAFEAAHAVLFLRSDIATERFEHLKGATGKLRVKLDDLPLEELENLEEAER